MTRHVDHLVIPVADLSGAARELAAAGFVVTPQADHPFGTSNRLVVFVETYLELVAVTRPDLVPADGFAAEVVAALSSGTAVSHVAIATTDAVADNAALASAGLAVGAVFDFSRPAPRADGGEVTAAFSLAMAAGDTPVGAFLCAQHTPEAVWHPSHLEHPNGATNIVMIRLPGPVPPAVELFSVTGIEFNHPPAIWTDGRHEPIRIGALEIVGFAADESHS